MNLIILTPRHLSLLYGSTIPKPSKDIICYELDVLANPTKYIAFLVLELCIRFYLPIYLFANCAIYLSIDSSTSRHVHLFMCSFIHASRYVESNALQTVLCYQKFYRIAQVQTFYEVTFRALSCPCVAYGCPTTFAQQPISLTKHC